MSEREDLIRRLYAAALKRPIGERSSFVATQSHGDDEVRRRVEALLTGQQETALPGHDVAGGSLLAAGTLIGTYRIDGPLGAGGMGIVYRATDTKLNRPAAIKVLPENLADPEARRRFQREAQMVSSLNHPHIVTVYDAGEYQDRQYLITEYVDGGTLRQWAAQPRGWQQIVELLIGVADGIAVAHEAGILHRDIKPENILLAKNGYAKLADFGLAKLLEVDPLADDAFQGIKPGDNSTLIGTAAYMSPEQAQGRPLDARSDVYSFALVLHELLSGTRPIAVGEVGAGAPAVAPLGEAVPASLRSIVAKALETQPADRYQTMRELVIDLRRLVRRSSLEDPLPSGPLRAPAAQPSSATTPPPRLRRRIAYAAAAFVLFAALAIITYYRYALLGSARGPAVAVLPFANETGDPNDAQISEGLGDALRARLTELPGVSVAARASSLTFRGQNADPRTIARSLGVGMLINGSLRRQGKALDLLVELLDDRGFAVGQPLTFQGTDNDLQKLQQRMASEIGAVLVPAARASLAAEAPTPTAQSESANMLVMFGSHYDHEVRDDITIDEPKLDKAIDYYRRAAAVDPKSIAAYTRLASALLVKGSVDEARAPLTTALHLSESMDPSSASSELSDLYYTTAIFLLSTFQRGAADEYKKALAFNHSNVDALAGYGQWLFTHQRSSEADPFFREAIRLDRQSLSRYTAYAEYLGSIEDMDKLRDLGREIAASFPNARGFAALARLYDMTGELDIGIAWGLKALQQQPDDPETKEQIAELYAKIGDFTAASRYDPGSISQFWLQGRYGELIDLAQDYLIEHPEDLDAKYYLAFAYNATGDFATAKYLLERMGVPVLPDRDPGNPIFPRANSSYIDALQSLGGNESRVEELARERVANTRNSLGPGGHAKSWWANALGACAYTQVGNYSVALDLLDAAVNAKGLPWSSLLQDSPCFKRLAGEPRYKAAIDHLEDRKKQLRERLPGTLKEYGVGDVIAAR
jgi:serine/threonine protein kinase/TolB-like protein/thioredoxin-like negative regulator of GroEL